MEPRRLILKDGRIGVIRHVTNADAIPAWESHRAVTAAGIGVTRSLRELDKPEQQIIEEFREYTEGVHSGKGGCMIAAEVEGAFAGSGVVRRLRPSRLRHSAHIGLGIRPEYQGLGLGRAIMLALIDWARKGEGRGVTRLDLNVFADNRRAVALYESLGFVTEGRRRNMIRYEDGTYTDDLCMALLVG